MRVLDLFSGIGGFSLGLERAGMETVAFCEFDKHARLVLEKHWPGVPIFNDVTKMYRFASDYEACPDCGEPYCHLCSDHFSACQCVGCGEFDDEVGTIDVVCGGFPCQDLSGAGKQAGFGGVRSSLYTEMLRIIGAVQPRWAIFENVAGLLTGDGGRWFSQFLNDLAKIGFDAEWLCIPASSVGAWHRRERVWIIAYPNSNGLQRVSVTSVGTKQAETIITRSAITRAYSENRGAGGRWETESNICRVVDGVPRRSHRLKQLGNAVCPPVVEVIGRAIMEFEHGMD